MSLRQTARRATGRPAGQITVNTTDGLTAWQDSVTIRLAGADDQSAIDRVAGRDSRPAPAGPLLVAERGGTIEAALSLHTGGVVADPFRRTAELVELLRVRGAGRPSGAGRAVSVRARRLRSVRGARLAGAAGCP
jgi:hypothetical protein